ncbi:MAG: class I SAM-dependent methyltransferase [Flavobacteriales bacterium]
MSQSIARKQLLVVLGAAVAVAASGIGAHAIWGSAGLVLPMALGVAAIVLAVFESRAYQHAIYLRVLQEQRSTYAQIESLIGVTRAIDPVLPLPAMRSWAASPDLLRVIVSRILADKTASVVEASSGVSTLVIAYCMKRNGAGKVVALEHDPEYAQRTRDALAEHGLLNFAEVIDAPLVRQQIGADAHLWYDLSRARLPSTIDLLVVDGPPDTSQHMARYPAVPLLKHLLKPGALVLLDDGARADERAAAKRWAESVPGSTLRYLELEAGAWMLRMPA